MQEDILKEISDFMADLSNRYSLNHFETVGYFLQVLSQLNFIVSRKIRGKDQ